MTGRLPAEKSQSASDSTRTSLAPAAMGLLSKSHLGQLLVGLALLGATPGDVAFYCLFHSRVVGIEANLLGLAA